ncbi:MAG: flagellar biosynthetic protein FliO [Clostridiales bacterium]|nr:flagellar biosynthetic protein FliO [Clostridiales bacterium]
MFDGFFSLLCMVMVIGGVLLLAYWYSRFLGKSYGKTNSGANLKVVEQVRLGPDKQLILVRLQSHVYLLGASQNGIQLLAELEGELTAEETGAEEKKRSGFAGFQEVYDSLCQKKKGGDR